MLARKSSILLAVTTIAILVLLYSRRIGTWSGFVEPSYHHDPHRSHHAPQRHGPFGQAHPPPPPPPPHRRPLDPACEGFPDTSNILLVMKTGASEAFARIPTQLMTTLRCLPESDFLLFSDMAQNIAGHPVHDSLATVLPEAQLGNPDFDLYRRQKWCAVDQDSCNKLVDKPADEGWALDKYKNIHIAEKAYAMRPGYDWYLFVDADSYVLWGNMVQWLKTLDPGKKLYLGSVTLINDFRFAHGGSGYVLSRAAMEGFAGKHPGVGNEYDVRAKDECCGDYLFAVALKNKTGIAVQQMWPTINGEKPTTLPFGPSHWCHPIVTMHHLNAEELNTVWHFERRALAQSPNHHRPLTLTMKDIYSAFLAPHLNATRSDWDNLADNRYYLDQSNPNKEWEEWKLQKMKKESEYNDHEKEAHKSSEHCAAACRSLPVEECFSWRYQEGECVTGNAFALGRPVKRVKGPGVAGKRVVSGWEVERIRGWIGKQGSCGKVRWPDVHG